MNTITSSFLIFLLLHLPMIISNAATDTLTTTQLLRDGDTLVSSTRIFELGFFSPGNSKNRYVGIWFKDKTVGSAFWVANRGVPLRNTTMVVLKLIQSGQLIIQDQGNNNTIFWSSTNASSSKVVPRNPVVQLLDTGNLVVRGAESADKSYQWQSFDYPSDTSLPGMDLGVNLVTGKQIYLTSWRSSEDPALGDFTMSLDVTGYPQMVFKRGADVVYRLGPWNGVRFSGTNYNKIDPPIEALIMNSSMIYHRRFIVPNMLFSRYTLNPAGFGQQNVWVNQSNDWVVYYKFPGDICDSYGICGAHGSCNNVNLPLPPCGCLERFVPRNVRNWDLSDWSDGCIRRTPLNCSDDVFMKYSGLKMPDARITRYNESLSLGECEGVCLRNCSCTAYSNLNISNGGSGCLLWFGDLVDMRHLSREPQVIYIRMANSELMEVDDDKDSNGRKRKIIIAISTSLVGFILLGLSLTSSIWERKKNDRKLTKEESNDENLELPIYDLPTISKATNNFSSDNKLGEGGFGPVYKGILVDGKEVAVKRLSASSTQGVDEFKNEVVCIAKLQHRNLVKLVGCCIEGEEKMLIYEYMPNKSLDFILFDKTKCKQFDWPKRFHVINGIARGLVYLHQDSLLRIIHRDLKASNVLLDDELNPKISDFGLAKSFGGNVIEFNTKRVVGTYGYMSPEYAGYGLYSFKSDVYSFGVLVLEIVSSQKSQDFHHAIYHHNLIGHAWVLYKEGRVLELVDPNILNSDHLYILERSIHVALLCVQQLPEKRPIMSSVVLMLGSEGVLSEPIQPGFFTTLNEDATRSSNECTITQLVGR